MTLIEYIATNGWGVDTRTLKLHSLVNVGFMMDTLDDEADFHVVNVWTREGLHELCSLYDGFCDETGIDNDTVTSARIPFTADTDEELWRYCD